MLSSSSNVQIMCAQTTLQVAHLVVDDHVVLCRHVIGNVVIDNQTQKPVKQSQVNLFVHLLIA